MQGEIGIIRHLRCYLNVMEFLFHGCVFKSLRFHFTENAMKVLHPHDRFQIVLTVHTETMKTTENAINLPLRMCRRRYLNS